MREPERRHTGGPLHVVQVSNDESLVAPDADVEPLDRQRTYARALDRRAPGSQMTIAVITSSRRARAMAEVGLCIVPVRGRRTGQLRIGALLRRIDRARPIDVLTTQRVTNEAWVTLAFARRRGIPVVGQVHYDIFAPAAWPRRIVDPIRRAVTLARLRDFDALRVVSRRLLTGVQELVVDRPVELLPIPVTLASPPGVREVDPDRPVVLYVGRFSPEKDLDGWAMIAGLVAARHAGARFRLIGDGPGRRDVVRALERAGLRGRYELPGWVPQCRLAAEYAGAALLLLTSRYEGFGRVAVEAGRCGVPVVAPQVAGLEDIVESGVTGFLHPSGEVDAMAASVERLLADAELARSMGAAGRDRVADLFAADQLTAGWVDLLVGVARRGATR